MAINVGGSTAPDSLWLPDAMAMKGGGGGNATDGAKIGYVDENHSIDWSGRFFDHVGKHTDGTPFKALRAIGSPIGSFSLALWEDDVKYDECDKTSNIALADLPLASRFKSKGQQLDFDDQGDYTFLPCAMSHALVVRACSADSDCLEHTKCVGGACL